MRVEHYLDGLASMHGRPLNKIAAQIFLKSLEGYSESDVLKALDRCAKELRTFPTIADVIDRIDDGHPNVEEAWAMVPKTEDESVCWTEQIQKAFYACLPLIKLDPVGARMTFKEVYAKELLQARHEKTPPRWNVSLGHDTAKRINVLYSAVEKQRITSDFAKCLLPDNLMQNSIDKIVRQKFIEHVDKLFKPIEK